MGGKGKQHKSQGQKKQPSKGDAAQEKENLSSPSCGQSKAAAKKRTLRRIFLAPVSDSSFSGASVNVCINPTLSLSHGGFAGRLESVLDSAACEAIIGCAEAHGDWKEQADSVDGKAEWQHTIVDFSRRFATQSLGGLVECLAEEAILPALQTAFGLEPSELYMHWAFVRAYAPSRRLQFPVHRDSSVATANILLSSPGAFDGAELYVLGPAWGAVDKLAPKEFRRQLPEDKLRRDHAVNYQQGECVMHLGKRMHGVLPILSGTRHTLILMFYERKLASGG